MASTSEVGHAKNVANLQKLTEQVTVYSQYQPPVDNLKIPNLQALYTSAAAKLAEVEEKRHANKNAISARQAAFEKLKPTATKIINHLEILGLPSGTISQARSLNRTLQGGQKKPSTPAAQNAKPSGSASTSRQSFTQLAENFRSLLQLIETVPAYSPNEEDLKLATLDIYRESLVEATKSVDKTEAELNQILMERDKMLYTEGTGIYSIAQNVKKYVKSLYGATSPEYTNVSAIEFTNRK